jgi:hypothetical protein
VEIMQDVNKSASIVTIDIFHIGATRHECFNTPVLRHHMEEKTFWNIRPTVSSNNNTTW